MVKLKPKGATKINSSGDADLGSTINSADPLGRSKEVANHNEGGERWWFLFLEMAAKNGYIVAVDLDQSGLELWGSLLVNVSLQGLYVMYS